MEKIIYTILQNGEYGPRKMTAEEVKEIDQIIFRAHLETQEERIAGDE